MFCKKKIVIVVTLNILIAVFVTACVYDNDPADQGSSTSNAETGADKVKEDMIYFTILGGETLSIHKDRIRDETLYTEYLENRWDLSEIDKILNSIKGVWEIDEYVGFVTPSMYYPDLFDYDDNLDQKTKDKLIETYEEKVYTAKNNIPDIYFSIKENYIRETNNNYIYANGHYQSPFSIILSVERIHDNYPVLVDQTTISYDFIAEYPVLYVKFFFKTVEYDEIGKRSSRYEPATLVITSDDRFYILMDGAFYSLKEYTGS